MKKSFRFLKNKYKVNQLARQLQTFEFKMIKLNKVIAQTPSSISNPYLEYLSTFKDLYRHPNDISDLHDGVILYELFQLINGFVLVGDFDENPRTFSHKFGNLKVLFQSIQKYWNEHLERQIQSEDIDKIQMAYNKSVAQIQKFLQLFVKTAINSQNKDPFIQKMLQTSQSTQMVLKKVIQKTLNPVNRESPRKQKQKRMIDKLIELDHENQKLQNFISIICDETLELQLKLKSLSELLLQKNEEITKLQNNLYQYTLTPRKPQIERVSDTSQRKSNQIQYLKSQIVDLKNIIQDYENEREKFDEKMQILQTTRAQLQLSQSIIQSNQTIIDQVQSTENSLNQSKAELMNKNNLITILRAELDKSKATITELERKEVNLRAELQRKNILISQLMIKIEKPVPKEAQGRHNLYLEFPEIVNTEANAYIQINKSLREQLERSRFTLLKTVAQLQKTNADNQRLKKHEEQNKKLKKMIFEEKTNKGEEISLLVNALYHLRKQVKESVPHTRKILQPKNV